MRYGNNINELELSRFIIFVVEFKMINNLSPRKIEICKYIANGLKNEEIAKIIKVSKHTVKAYVSSIINDACARNRTQLAYILGKENFDSKI